MRRLFIAIALPEEVKKRIKALQRPFEGINWQPGSQMHLTLRFLGDTRAARAEKLKSQLKQIEEQVFSLTLTKLGGFPELPHPKVVWIGVEKSFPLRQLHQKVERVCRQNDVAHNDKSFVPHITLGRVKKGSRQLTDFLVQPPPIPKSSFKVTNFKLYASRLTHQGARHEALATVPLSEQ